MKRLKSISILYFFLVGILCGVSENSFGQSKPRGNVSAMTGQKFKMRAKKNKGKKQINYINSIKLVAGTGTSHYFGDLCDGFDCAIPRPNLVLGVEYRLDESITLRGEVNWVQLAGSDEGGKWASRNLSFKSNNLELSGTVLYDIFEYNKMYRRRHFASPHVFLGFGITTNSPKAELDGTSYALRPLQTEGASYSAMSFVIPFGAGVKLKINPLLNLTVEAGYRFTFTDYLDDVSSEYSTSIETGSTAQLLSDRRAEYISSLEDPTSEPLRTHSTRGNPDSRDGYFLFQVKGEYTLKVTKQHYNINSNVNRMRIIKSIKKKP